MKINEFMRKNLNKSEQNQASVTKKVFSPYYKRMNFSSDIKIKKCFSTFICSINSFINLFSSFISAS